MFSSGMLRLKLVSCPWPFLGLVSLGAWGSLGASVLVCLLGRFTGRWWAGGELTVSLRSRLASPAGW